MGKSITTAAIVLFLAACSTMKSDSGMGNIKVDIIHPDIAISQLTSVPAAAEHMQGAVPIRYRIRVANRSSQTITLKRVGMQSIGYGAYSIAPTSQSVALKVDPDNSQSVDVWVPANVDFDTTLGANGPVSIRLTLQFDSPVGQFQEMVVRQVSAAGVAGTTRDK